MTQFQNAFISYGRADSKDFARHLNDRLIAQGLEVWFDFEDIPLGVDYQKQIDDGIDKADNILFIISPHSINSPYCGLEVELALKRRKRIIPLLHVEEISRETWQQRHPNETESDWQAYKAAGKHASFPNMHEEIRKINWVYMRENIDDFEDSFQGLLKIFQRQQHYVRQHTILLAQALDWERNQKQIPHLLIGEERQQAEAWLKTEFEQEQPPCLPSDLHCEFITESTKNANNMMTQVFLAHADVDREISERVRCSLMRAGITVWSSQQDIGTGEDFQVAIDRGLEEADNVVYLISPDSLQSDYCQRELDSAIALNKRIIPLLVRPTDGSQMPPTLRELQYIDLTDNVVAADYQQDESELLRSLREDATYYTDHKVLLARALKWERQQRNPSILLRGHNLHHAEVWLKTAQARAAKQEVGADRHLPTMLQQTFIQESLRQPPAGSLDIFISYSSTDAGFARKLNDALQVQGKRTWFDQESIASGAADFQQEIHRGIAASDNFLFVLSPRAVTSKYCRDEVEYAAKLNKRFITVLHQQVNQDDLHAELAKVQWIDFHREKGDFADQFNQLIRTLDTDREHVSSHSKWLLRALEWDQLNRSEDLLLRGSEFAIADAWLREAETERKQPEATPLQRDFVERSRDAIALQKKRNKRQILVLRSLLAVASTALLVSIGVSAYAFTQATIASLGEKAALARSLFSEDPLQALVQLIQLTGKSQTQLNKVTRSVRLSLHDALAIARERNQLVGSKQNVTAVAISPDGQYIVSGSEDRSLRLWDRDGNPIGLPFWGHEDYVTAVDFSPNGQYIISASRDKTLRLWDLQGNSIGQPFQGHTQEVSAVAFSPDGQLIVSGGRDGMRLWTVDGSPQPFQGNPDRVFSVRFSPDGRSILSGNWKTVQLWDLAGKPIGEPFSGHEYAVFSVAFSPDGQSVVSGGSDGRVRLIPLQRLLDPEDKSNAQTFLGHEGHVTAVAFSPDGKMIASGSWDKTIRLWDLKGHPIAQPFSGHADAVSTVVFSPDGHNIVSGSWDKTVRLWDTPLAQAVSDDTWDVLLQKACDRLRFHPSLLEDRTKLHQDAGKTCQKFAWNKVEKAAFLLRQGQTLARAGDRQAAIAKFTTAQKLDADLDFDPAAEAERLETLALQASSSAPAEPLPELPNRATYGQVSLSQFALNSQGNVVQVAAGEEIQAVADYVYDCTDCQGGSINQIIVGIAGQNSAQACLYNGSIQGNGSAEFSLTAPTEPGTYFIRFRYAQDYDCDRALGWWRVDGEPTADANIGAIVVTERSAYPATRQPARSGSIYPPN